MTQTTPIADSLFALLTDAGNDLDDLDLDGLDEVRLAGEAARWAAEPSLDDRPDHRGASRLAAFRDALAAADLATLPKTSPSRIAFAYGWRNASL